MTELLELDDINLIVIPNDVQVNFSADGITMNLFSIFENDDECTEKLFLLMTSVIGPIDLSIDITDFLIRFDENNTITFLFQHADLNMQEFNKYFDYSEYVSCFEQAEEIVDFYTLFKHFVVNHTIKILKTSNITSFLKQSGHIIHCEFSHTFRNPNKQIIHTDESLFVSLTYESPTLTPEIILKPRINVNEPELRRSQGELPIQFIYPENIKKIFKSIQAVETEYYNKNTVYPILRFNIEDLKYPSVVFSDFTIFHASPHTGDDSHDIIKNMDFNKLTKHQYTEKQIIPLKACLGRENCIMPPQPQDRSFLAMTFNLLTYNATSLLEQIATEFTTVSLSDILQPPDNEIVVVDITPDTYEHNIGYIINSGRISGTNLHAKGGDLNKRKKKQKTKNNKNKNIIKKQASKKKKRKTNTKK